MSSGNTQSEREEEIYTDLSWIWRNVGLSTTVGMGGGGNSMKEDLNSMWRSCSPSNFQTLKSQQSTVENQSILTVTYFKKTHERVNENKFKKAHESCRFFLF